jgi:hypothetical protein
MLKFLQTTEVSMIVLYQEWLTPASGIQVSISKDYPQHKETVETLRSKNMWVPRQDPSEVYIPDECSYADKVQEKTQFLDPDELDILDFFE